MSDRLRAIVEAQGKEITELKRAVTILAKGVHRAEKYLEETDGEILVEEKTEIYGTQFEGA